MSFMLYFGVMAVIALMMTAITAYNHLGSRNALKEYKDGAFYEECRQNVWVWVWEPLLGFCSLGNAAFWFLLLTLVKPRGETAIITLIVLALAVPIALIVRSIYAARRQPHGVIHRLGLDKRRSNSIATGPMRTSSGRLPILTPTEGVDERRGDNNGDD